MLFFNTVSDFLKDVLFRTMVSVEFNRFRLVGGTALGLQLGHRLSVDIDLFTDARYGSIDFSAIERFLDREFPYVIDDRQSPVALGKGFFVGHNEETAIKLDVYYVDPFIFPEITVDGIRMASPEEISAMKIDVIQRGGRKKDFWDVHELLNRFSLDRMLEFHRLRYPFSHDRNEILENFMNINQADSDFDPICLRGKYWEIIKNELTLEATSVLTK